MLFTPTEYLETSDTFFILQTIGVGVGGLCVILFGLFWTMSDLSKKLAAFLAVTAVAGATVGTLAGIREHELRTEEHTYIAQVIEDTYGFPVGDEVVRALLTTPREGKSDELQRLSSLTSGGPAQMRKDMGSAVFFTPDKNQVTATLSWISDEWQLVDSAASVTEISPTTTDEDID